MRRPLLSLAVAFALGIGIQDWTGLPAWIGWLVAAACTLAAAGLALARLGGVLRFFLWVLAVFSLGSARGVLQPAPGLPEMSGPVVIRGVARSGWEVRPDRRRLLVEADFLEQPGGPRLPVRANLRLTVLREPDGPACPPVYPGQAVRALGRPRRPWTVHNPGVLDYRKLMLRRDVHWTATVRSCGHLMVEPGSHPAGLHGGIEKARASIRRFIHGRQASPAAKGVLLALTTGERGLVPETVNQSFRRSGLAHLLAISGLHLGFVALGLYVLLLKLFGRISRLALGLDIRRLAAALVIPACLLYTLLAGASLPAVRAAVMVICFLVAVILRRDPDPLHTLATAALIILGLWPQSLFEASFQLSFAAVGFIILGVPRLAEWVRMPLNRSRQEESPARRAGVRVVHFLLVGLAASLGTAPLVAWHFNQLSLVGLLANLLAVPLVTFLVVPLGLGMAGLLPLSTGLAGLAADGALWLTGLFCRLAGGVGAWSWVSLQVATPSVLQVIAFYALLLAVFTQPLRRAAWLGGACLLLLAAGWGAARLGPLLSKDMEVSFIDVGQGDSTLVRFPGGQTLLVDGGQRSPGGFDSGRRIVAPFLWGRGITGLDFVAVTHPESDHAGGLGTVVRLFCPREVWAAESLEASPATRDLAAAARETGARVRIFEAGQCPLAGQDFEVAVLWPPGDRDDLDPNERSLVIRIVAHGQTLLLTGDLEKRGEEGLLARPADLSARILKVGHHGGRGATGDRFLARVSPELAVISVGAANPHGLPNPEVLERLERAGVRVLRTDTHGAVTIVTSPASMRWSSPHSSSTSKRPSESMLRAVP